MKHTARVIAQTIVFNCILPFNTTAIGKEYDFLCTGQQTTTTDNNTIKKKASKQIIVKNNRLFIPGMMLKCSKKNNNYNCIKKRLNSRWQAKLDINKGVFWYQSLDVSQNKSQNFISVCKKNSPK